MLAQPPITISFRAAVWRSRLADISWFMRQINEHIAREANAEHNGTGRFNESHPWLSPFGVLTMLKFKFFPEKFVGGGLKSQALLDDKALTTYMAYVDFDPIRAKMTKTPDQSDYTSA